MTAGDKAAALTKRLNKLQHGGGYSSIEEWDAIYAHEVTKAGVKACSIGGDIIDVGENWFVHFHHRAFHAVHSPSRLLTIHPLRIDEDGIHVGPDGFGTVDVEAVHDEDPSFTETVLVP